MFNVFSLWFSALFHLLGTLSRKAISESLT